MKLKQIQMETFIKNIVSDGETLDQYYFFTGESFLSIDEITCFPSYITLHNNRYDEYIEVTAKEENKIFKVVM